ncbi:MAG: ABC transporter permease subunit, partial [Tissierellales bacterium]
EYYEAGAVDGISSKWQELFYITLPLMKPQLLFGAINSIVGSLGVFDIAVSVAGMPSPNYAGHTIVAHLYDYAFIRFQMGYASAISVVLFLMTFILGRIIMRMLSSKDL